MEITQLAKVPELIEIKLDDAAIIEEFGEEITFWMKDHLDIGTYFDFYKFQSETSGHELMSVLRKIILKKNGELALEDNQVLPILIILTALEKINDVLGKSKTKLSEKEVGTQL